MTPVFTMTMSIAFYIAGFALGYWYRATRRRRLRDPNLTLLLDGRRFVPVARGEYE